MDFLHFDAPPKAEKRAFDTVFRAVG